MNKVVIINKPQYCPWKHQFGERVCESICTHPDNDNPVFAVRLCNCVHTFTKECPLKNEEDYSPSPEPKKEVKVSKIVKVKNKSLPKVWTEDEDKLITESASKSEAIVNYFRTFKNPPSPSAKDVENRYVKLVKPTVPKTGVGSKWTVAEEHSISACRTPDEAYQVYQEEYGENVRSYDGVSTIFYRLKKLDKLIYKGQRCRVADDKSYYNGRVGKCIKVSDDLRSVIVELNGTVISFSAKQLEVVQ